jgi:8-oxo-dGTP pyrophosphatase MutT (NUDIX family)
MRFDLPLERIAAVDAVDVRLAGGPHPFEVEQGAAIDLNWAREKAANPALFDGTVVLLSDLVLRGRTLAGTCHAVRYATLLHWRHSRPAGAHHAYAHAALVSSDNALIAIRMAAHTANPGKVYFAAGSFEPEDFVDGRVDVAANMAREVREETGLEIGAAPRDAGYHLFSRAGSTVIFQRYWLDETADGLADRIRAFVATETVPEIEGPVTIRSADDRPDGIAPHMLPIIDWHFSTPRT